MDLHLEPSVITKVRSLSLHKDAKEVHRKMDPGALHIALNALQRIRLQPRIAKPEDLEEVPYVRFAEDVEQCFVSAELAETRDQVAKVPRDPEGFIAWFEGLYKTGPGQFDPFFEFLATRATREQLALFIKQEFCGEIGFDDLIALTQIRLPARAKMELARNFWDEQGCGQPEGVHGPHYVAMAHELGVKDTPDSELVWETLALANLLTALAYHRRYTWQSLGALAVIEMTSPSRAPRIVSALERVGCTERACYYFRLHSTIDVGHWNACREEILRPLVTANPELIVPIAEGALLRLNAGLRLIRRYREMMGVEAPC